MDSTSDLQPNGVPRDDRVHLNDDPNNDRVHPTDAPNGDGEQETPDSKTKSQAIIVAAVPLSYKRPNDDAIITAFSPSSSSSSGGRPDPKTNSKAIVALPLSYKPPNDYSMIASSSSGRKPNDSDTNSRAIVSLPWSYKPPNDNGVVIASSSSSRRRRPRRTSETPRGWLCEARAWTNGVVDKFYYQIGTRVRCRSLKEVERYMVHGIRPGPNARQLEKQILAAAAASSAAKTTGKEKEEASPSTEARAEGVAAAKDKGKAKMIHSELSKDEQKSFVEKFLAEAWHNMMEPTNIQTAAWQEMEMIKQQEVEKAVEMKLEEEREKMIQELKEERKELEKKFEEERAQLHQWMKDEVDHRIQLQLDAILPTLLQGKDVPPPSGGCNSTGI